MVALGDEGMDAGGLDSGGRKDGDMCANGIGRAMMRPNGDAEMG